MNEHLELVGFISPSTCRKRARNWSQLPWASDDEDVEAMTSDRESYTSSKRLVLSTPGSSTQPAMFQPPTPGLESKLLPYGMGPIVDEPTSPTPPRRSIVRRNDQESKGFWLKMSIPNQLTEEVRNTVCKLVQEVERDLGNLDTALPSRFEQILHKLDVVRSFSAEDISSIGMLETLQRLESTYQEQYEQFERQLQQNRRLDAWLRR